MPLVDPETGEFEVNVDGFVSSGGMGGPAILPLSLAKMAEMTQAFPDGAFSGIGGIATFAHALNYFLLGLRHRPGRDGGHAGPRDRPQRDPGPDRRAWPSSWTATPTGAGRAWRTSAGATAGGSSRSPPSAAPDDAAYRGGYQEDDAEGYAASLAKS